MSVEESAQCQRPDWGYRAIVTTVFITAIWLLLLPLSQTVQRIALNRFHLQTGSFAAWAVQGPVPAMYNFHNQAIIEPSPWNSMPWDTMPWDQPAFEPQRWAINHFPTRTFTFGYERIAIRDPQHQMITLRSRYRGQTLQTRWLVDQHEDGTLSVSGEVIP